MIKRKLGEKPSFGRDLKRDFLKYLRVGVITRVDCEEGRVDVDWLDNFGGRTELFLPSAFNSPRGTIRGMPEIGSHVICGWIRQEQNMEMPIILGFVELNTKSSYEYRLSRGKGPETLKEIASIREKIGWNSKRLKRRKLYPGETQMESAQGAEVYLDENVYISNDRLNEIEIRSADQAISQSSRQNYINTSATRIWNGMISRQPIPNLESIQPTTYPNGQKVYIVTEKNNPFHLGGTALNEYRIEMYDKSDGTLPVNEINAGVDINPLRPFLTHLMGTLVGNDKEDSKKYGKVLRPQIFSLPIDSTAKVDEVECLPEEYDSLAGCYQLKFSNGTSITVDKEGHIFSNVSASTGKHPLGEGRSWEANFDGSVKWVIGTNANQNQSFILDTKGSIKETLGFDNNKLRSKETIAQKGIYTEVLAPDKDGFASTLKTNGDTKEEVGGTKTIITAKDQVLKINGKVDEQVLGAKNVNVIGDQNTIIGGSNQEVIIKDQTTKIGQSRDTWIVGPPLMPGKPADNLKITVGNSETSLLAGNYKVKVTLGNITVQTLAGLVDINSITGKVTVNGLLNVTIKSGAKIDNVAPLVNLGALPVKAGILTSLTLDQITGLPQIGSTSVFASM